MRVENSFPNPVDPRGDRSERPAKAAVANPTQTDHFTSSTADLVSLAIGSRAMQTAWSSPVGREDVIERLKNAYDSGSIRPDASRIAAAILRFGAPPAGDAV
jgi:anti-sigma28 factor (negative regulator of flagellin synthesis)